MARENTKQQILEAALELFSEKGFEASSMSEIADTVGIKKLLYIVIIEQFRNPALKKLQFVGMTKLKLSDESLDSNFYIY
ncbi:MAG: TetR/AcrR family transcriptional regulator [Selenomonadales bacterium]|nr:TetR/AcrR family transcriptional regulator [Selenomonadales bacterium]